ncbi:protein of unknown function [Rhodovastum atsumiense]|nr:protein of unknown function [Rhodovastum atsumiense]
MDGEPAMATNLSHSRQTWAAAAARGLGASNDASPQSMHHLSSHLHGYQHSGPFATLLAEVTQ